MCKFNRIGCQWRGPFHEVEVKQIFITISVLLFYISLVIQVHESVCVHPHRTGGELMEYLLNVDSSHQEEKKLYATLFDLLSFEKIAFSGKLY